MNKLSLSIILPCYNVEYYISDCLDSLYSQNLPEPEYEVICVNDCSNDNTRNIIVEYQQKHKNLKLIDHTINKRQGGARNTGINAAIGEYIWFVDPDDFIRNNTLSELINLCIDNSLDTLIFNFERVDLDGKFNSFTPFVTDSEVLTGLNYIYKYWGEDFLSSYHGSIWNRIFKKEFLFKNNFIFKENMFWEDVDYSLKTIFYAERIMSIYQVNYYYRTNYNSVMNSLKLNNNMSVLYDSTIRLGFILMDLSESIQAIDKNIADKLKKGAVWRVNKFTKPLLKADFSKQKEFFSIIKNNKNFVDDNRKYFNSINKFILRSSYLAKYLIFLISYIRKFVSKK